MTVWRTWIRQPQSVWLRQAIFQIHLWTGLALGLYVVVICLSGSVLVYRNELYAAFSPEPMFVEQRQERLPDGQFEAAVRRAFVGYEITRTWRGERPNQAVELELTQGSTIRRRLFDPYTGEDLGDAVPVGFRATAWLLNLHDNLLAGDIGRRTNGVGATIVILSALTGLVVWWPGALRWRRSASIDWRSNWKQFSWSLHSALGVWFVLFILMWGITGLYLSYPTPFNATVERYLPFDPASPDEGLGDRVLFWLGYAHFGRFGGRLPGCARGGACNEIFKATWAVFGLVPVAMAVTGGIMWWNRAGAALVRGKGKP